MVEYGGASETEITLWEWQVAVQNEHASNSTA